MSFQQVTIMGRLGKDPEARVSDGGKTVCKFSVATSEKRGGTEQTTWWNVVTFDKTAELCSQYLTKGRQVLIVGRIEISEYEKDGVKQRSMSLIANNVTFISDGSGKGEVRSAPAAKALGPKASDGFIDDDLPFARFDPPCMVW